MYFYDEFRIIESRSCDGITKGFKVKAKPIKKMDVRKMAIIGVLAAISIMLSMTPLGFIPIGPTNATIMHIPVIIGAILEGPVVGIVVGFIFGATSLIKSSYYAYNNFFCVYKSIGICITKDTYRYSSLLCL